jgi:hypothetical protein
VSAPAPHLDPRRVAVLVWAAMVVMLGLFLVMALALPEPANRALHKDLVFWAAVVTSSLGVSASRVVPLRLDFAQAGFRPEALAFTRFMIAWVLCEGVGLFPLLCQIVDHDHRLFAVAAVDALALVLYFPSQNRWAELAAGRDGARSAPMVRR